MRHIRFANVLVALALSCSLACSGAQAQTVVNLTSFDPALLGDAATSGASLLGSTNLDVVNTAGTGSVGGLFPAAVSQLNQTGANQLNTLGMLVNGGVAAVTLGTASSVPLAPAAVTINTITSAVAPISGVIGSKEGSTSLTIANTNVATNLGPADKAILDISAPGGTLAGGNQIGVNTANGVGAAFATGTGVTLSQIAAGVGLGATSAPGAGSALNMSVVNTLLAYTARADAQVVGQPATGQTQGVQTAINGFNTATLLGTISASVNQDARGLTDIANSSTATLIQPVGTVFQSVNRALAYNLQDASLQAAANVGVSALNQLAGVGINTLALAASPLTGGAAIGTTTLSGTQTLATQLMPGATTDPFPSTPFAMTVNTVNASTGTVEGFQPASGEWAGFTAGLGVSLPEPGYPTGNNGPRQNSTVTLANIGQTISTGYNSVTAQNQNVALGPAGFSQVMGVLAVASSINNAGSQALLASQVSGIYTPAGLASTNIPLGYSGFSPLNSANASAGFGAAGIAGLTQSFQLAGNSFAGSADITGALSQTMAGASLAAASLLGASQMSCSAPGNCTTGVGGSINRIPGSTANGGPSIQEALNPLTTAASTDAPDVTTGGPYQAVSQQWMPASFATNGAYALLSGGGNTTVASVSQTTTVALNTLAAGGTISSGAAGTIAQLVYEFKGYGPWNSLNQGPGTVAPQTTPSGFNTGMVPGEAVQTISALTNNGNASNTGYNQSLGMGVNQVAAGGSVLGSVAQQAPFLSGSGATNPSNYSTAGVLKTGNAALSGQQSNVMSMNAISAAGTLGSAAAPAAISQTSPVAGVTLASADGFFYNGTGNNYQQSAPANLAMVSVEGGGMGNAVASNLGQLADNTINTAAAGNGVLGNVTQTSGGIASSLRNASYAMALPSCTASCPSIQPGIANPALGTGNAIQTGTAQVATQGQNLLGTGPSAAGTLNQIAMQATVLATGNSQFTASQHGYAVSTGTQAAANAANVVAQR